MVEDGGDIFVEGAVTMNCLVTKGVALVFRLGLFVGFSSSPTWGAKSQAIDSIEQSVAIQVAAALFSAICRFESILGQVNPGSSSAISPRIL